MEVIERSVRDTSALTGIMQWEHSIKSIYFYDLQAFEGTVYLSLESKKYKNAGIEMQNGTFIIGQPMTRYSDTYKCQIYGILNNGEKIKLSRRFYLVVDESNDITGESYEYPIDPNLVNGINAYITQKQSEIDSYTDTVIESIPSDYTELEARVDELENSQITTSKIENGAVTWEKLSGSLKSRISSAQGIGEQAIALLIEILTNALYTTDQSANITALEEALHNSNSDVIYQNDEVLTIEAVALEPYQSGEVLIFE